MTWPLELWGGRQRIPNWHIRQPSKRSLRARHPSETDAIGSCVTGSFQSTKLLRLGARDSVHNWDALAPDPGRQGEEGANLQSRRGLMAIEANRGKQCFHLRSQHWTVLRQMKKWKLDTLSEQKLVKSLLKDIHVGAFKLGCVFTFAGMWCWSSGAQNAVYAYVYAYVYVSFYGREVPEQDSWSKGDRNTAELSATLLKSIFWEFCISRSHCITQQRIDAENSLQSVEQDWCLR